MTCYKERESCVKNDFQEEVKCCPPLQTFYHSTFQVDLLASNFHTMKEIYLKWLELGERVGHMAVEGELSL